MVLSLKTLWAALALSLVAASAARAEDGYRLWLRYDAVEAPARAAYSRTVRSLVVEGKGPAMLAAGAELERGLSGLLARRIPLRSTAGEGALVVGTPRSSPIVAALRLPLARLGGEGYLIRSVRAGSRRATVIAANSDVGALYGAFAFLRLIQTRRPIDSLDLADAPRLGLRLLNHWDNLDRRVERGYAGDSLWDWQKLPDWKDPRYADYARANASVGINGTVLNNVNANAEILAPRYLQKVAALADVFRPWGIRVYLSARFSAPIELGGLNSADPLDPRVRAWWKAKADEIYRHVPDFGGFLVKANSEGQPGPQDYGRSHAEGANMLADALAPHGGAVIWRAFVYSASAEQDRAKQAYEEFQPLDGKFRPNVLLQVKNGPIDFQPREPFHPLFGAMPSTALTMEVQITKEYLGFATHLAYLGTMWEEALGSRTWRPDSGTTVAGTLAGMAGVANAGADRNWSGSHFDQANWYAFGRLAWDPSGSARTIAEEWTRMTWGNDPRLVGPVVEAMMGSRQAVVDYMTPLGLHHLMATGHHYGPGPWVSDLARPDWNPTYYHRADSGGIGFDRTASGSDAIGQYAPEAARRLERSEEYLLWFHHLPWDHRLGTGRSLWAELVSRYDSGVAKVEAMRRTWLRLAPFVDPERHAQVAAFLAIQEKEARWWRDASIAYFSAVSRRPLPPGVAPPAHPLDWYKAIRLRHVPGSAE
ncbi:MAG TPA: alpha-glucuronidase family glycosyl hydrolase [Allosphingosinicella sp.]|jgi:alpha-glucuronidase|nr:alpha-glucuronidase family glycosyl hydrolase [Allosphingosinicella sp.]